MTIDGLITRGYTVDCAADLAAPALLALLLRRPPPRAEIREIATWLEPDDFASPRLGAIYATIVGLTRHHRAVHPRHVLHHLAVRTYTGALGPPRSQPPQLGYADQQLSLDLLEIMSAAPTGPVSDVARIYATEVLDEAVRRRVDQMGTRIARYARPGPDTLETAYTAASRLGAVLAIIADGLGDFRGRVGPANATVPRPADTTPAPGSTSVPPLGFGLTPMMQPILRSPAALAAASAADTMAERRLVATCLHSAVARTAAAQLLRPQDFTDPAARAAWSGLLALLAKNRPVNVVTLAIEAQIGRRPRLTAADALALAAVADLPSLAFSDIEVVAQAALRRVAAAAAQQLHRIAAGRERSAPTLAAAAATVQAAQLAVQRLRGHDPEEQQYRPSSATSRAATQTGTRSTATASAAARAGQIADPRPPNREHPPSHAAFAGGAKLGQRG